MANYHAEGNFHGNSRFCPWGQIDVTVSQIIRNLFGFSSTHISSVEVEREDYRWYITINGDFRDSAIMETYLGICKHYGGEDDIADVWGAEMNCAYLCQPAAERILGEYYLGFNVGFSMASEAGIIFVEGTLDADADENEQPLEVDTNTILNDQLYTKMSMEQRKFYEQLIRKPQNEILDRFAYEYRVREDILAVMESLRFDDDHARALLALPNPLSEFFKAWEDTETDYMEVLANVMDRKAGELVAQRVRNNFETCYG